MALLAFQTFETENIFNGGIYIDPLDGSTDHDLANIAGQNTVDSTNLSTDAGMIGFDAFFETQYATSFGLNDSGAGDFAGITNTAPQPIPQGTQAYTISDPDGTFVFETDWIDISASIEVYGSARLFLANTAWENTDFVRVFMRGNNTGVYWALRTEPFDPDALGIKNQWLTVSNVNEKVNAVEIRDTQVQFVVELYSGVDDEQIWFDDIKIFGRPPYPVQNDSSGSNHDSVQDAIDNANEGETLVVDRNFYTEEGTLVTRTDDLTLDYSAHEPGYFTIVVATGANSFTHTGTRDMHIRLTNGDKSTSSGSGDDLVRGFLGDNVINLGFGSDRAYGGEGNDQIFGGGQDDLLFGQAGDDLLSGQNDDDRLFGGDGNDMLQGGSGLDLLFGGAGADTINGGLGNDRLFGDDGADIFEFHRDSGGAAAASNGAVRNIGDPTPSVTGDGADRIFDFEDGIDLIRLIVGGDISFGDLVIQEQMANVGGQPVSGTVIDYSGDGSQIGDPFNGDMIIALINVRASDITADDFVFV